jgi:hypothetical protein
MKLVIYIYTCVDYCRNPVSLDEGRESDTFWKLLGGKGSYASSESLMVTTHKYREIRNNCFVIQVEHTKRPPRLFQCSNARGYFTVEQIEEFTQDVS